MITPLVFQFPQRQPLMVLFAGWHTRGGRDTWQKHQEAPLGQRVNSTLPLKNTSRMSSYFLGVWISPLRGPFFDRWAFSSLSSSISRTLSSSFAMQKRWHFTILYCLMENRNMNTLKAAQHTDQGPRRQGSPKTLGVQWPLPHRWGGHHLHRVTDRTRSGLLSIRSICSTRRPS